MNTILRRTMTGVIAAASIGAMVATTTSPAAAWGYHHRGWGPGAAIAGVVGGLALGALAAGASRPAYASPYYAEPAYAPPVAYDGNGYGPVCHTAWRPVYRSDGAYIGDRKVRVCD